MASAGGLAFTAAERMVDRVHRHAADVRPLAQPPAAARLADRHVLVIEIADLADRREALYVDLANFARRHLDRRVLAFLRHELHRRPGAARDLSAFPRPQLHVVEQRAERDVLQRQRIPRQDVGVLTGDDRVADLQAEGLQDVTLLAVGVGQERDPSRPVRVVLDRRHRRRNVALVALEVDDPVHSFVAAAAPPRRQMPRVVSAAGAVHRLDERLVGFLRRDLVERLDGLKPLTGRRGIELADRHLRALQELWHLLPFAQFHVGLLPVGPAPGIAALPLDLAVRDARTQTLDLRAEQLLDGALDLGLVRVRRDVEHDRPSVLAKDRRLLGNQRPADDICELHLFTLRWGPTPSACHASPLARRDFSRRLSATSTVAGEAAAPTLATPALPA